MTSGGILVSMKRMFVAAVLLSLTAAQALACTGGQQWLRESGPYTIDITNDTPMIRAGQPVHFDFGLTLTSAEPSDTSPEAPFDVVQVAIMEGDTMLLAKNLASHEDRELTGFDYTFPDRNGEYVLVARYMDGTHEIAATKIPLEVGSGAPVSGGMFGTILSVAAVLGALIFIGYRYVLLPAPSPSRRRRS